MNKKTLSPEQIAALYRIATEIHLGHKTIQRGKEDAQLLHGINPNTAGLFLPNLKRMLSGERYTSRMGEPMTRYFLDNIKKDFGDVALANALVAVSKHAIYCKQIGFPLPFLQKILEDYQ